MSNRTYNCSHHIGIAGNLQQKGDAHRTQHDVGGHRPVLRLGLSCSSPIPLSASNAGTLVSDSTDANPGSLYALVLSGNKTLGAVTPIGGLVLIGGWLALAL